MKSKKIILGLFFSICLMILINIPSYAGTQEWNSLDYNCTINIDGSMDVVETWNTYISETNTLFKDFKLDSSKFGGFSNAYVVKIVDGVEIPLSNVGQYQYHVDDHGYYALNIDDNTYEIAWNVGLEDSSDNVIYKIHYRVENAVKIYNDCAEIYWQFLSKDNSMTGDNITGKVVLPGAVSNIENLEVWMHGNLNGNVERTSESEVNFSLSNIYSNELLEIRLVVLENIFPLSTNVIEEDMHQKILDEEKVFADNANRERTITKIIGTIFFILVAAAYIFIFVLLIKKMIKYKKLGEELKSQEFPKNELDYFRDIPNEKTATPARAAYLYYFKNNNVNIEENFGTIFSGTMLDLALKGIISFEPLDKNNFRINLINSEKSKIKTEDLSIDEQRIYRLLIDVYKRENDLTIKDVQKYAKKEYDKFYDLKNNIVKDIDSYATNYNKINIDRKSQFDKITSASVIYFTLIIIFAVFFMVTFPLLIEFVICYLMCRKNAKLINVLTQEGYEESCQWKALKKYMVDFSLLKEKEVPDLILWEKYLVFATTFGVAKKVISQLKIVYPEFTNSSTYGPNYTYMYMMSDPTMGMDFMDRIDSGFNKVCNDAKSAYASAHYSSSSGSGGGFSSGGGGGGGGGSCGGR